MENHLKKKKDYRSYGNKDLGVSVFTHSEEGRVLQVENHASPLVPGYKWAQ